MEGSEAQNESWAGLEVYDKASTGKGTEMWLK